MTDEDTVDEHDENCECEECSVQRAVEHEEARADTYD